MSSEHLMDSDVVIVAAQRTPMGGLQGCFATLTAPQLGASAIAAALAQAGVDAAEVDEVLMGNVLSAGVRQAPARQASLAAGIGESVPCTTISKVCGSGMKAVMYACDQIKAGSIDVAVAGGMESMSQAPYFIAQARSGLRLGHGEIKDHMFFDGLEDAYSGKAMGSFAQATADKANFSREQMDAYALESLQRANTAITEGYFDAEVSPVTVKTRRDETVISHDEQPAKAKPEKIPTLRPAFAKEGTITAANSSSISDGAAALVVMSYAKAKALGLKPLAKIAGHTSYAHQPSDFTSAPIGAMKSLLEKVQWRVENVDLYEINEAFAIVTMLAMQQFNLDHSKVNVNGGACALGHPLGASGARIMVTLIHALKRLGKTKGMASLCIGGGEATAIAIEIIE